MPLPSLSTTPLPTGLQDLTKDTGRMSTCSYCKSDSRARHTSKLGESKTQFSTPHPASRSNRQGFSKARTFARTPVLSVPKSNAPSKGKANLERNVQGQVRRGKVFQMVVIHVKMDERLRVQETFEGIVDVMGWRESIIESCSLGHRSPNMLEPTSSS